MIKRERAKWLARVGGALVAVSLLMAALYVFRTEEPPLLAQTQYREKGQDIVSWTVLGPFLAFGDARYVGKDGPEWLGRDFLADMGLSENAQTVTTFHNLCGKPGFQKDVDGSECPRSVNLSGQHIYDFSELYKRPYANVDPQATVYAASVIKSQKSQSAYLMVGSAGGAKIWLNGQAISEVGRPRHLNRFDDVPKVQLRRGDNFLLIKVRASNISWGLTARIEPDAESALMTGISAQRSKQNHLLRSTLLLSEQDLVTMVNGAPEEAELVLRITRNGQTLTSAKVKAHGGRIPLSVPAGLYAVETTLGGRVYKEDFFVGDPASYYHQSRNEASIEKSPAVDHIGVQARFDALFAPPTKPRFPDVQREWERKVVHLLMVSSAITRTTAGFRLHSFVSKIDGQVQSYQLYIPASHSGFVSPIPLVLLLPTTVDASRPFIQSRTLSEHNEACRIAYMADSAGVAVAWVGFRSMPVGRGCDMAHIDEVYSDIAARYPVDKNRVSLLGICSGAAFAGMANMVWPKRFSAIAAINPIFRPSLDQAGSDKQFFDGRLPYVAAMSMVDPFDRLTRIRDVPFYVIHNGSPPGHGSLQQSLEFVEAVQMEGGRVRFEKRFQTEYRDDGAMRAALMWLAQQRRPHASDERSSAYFGPQQALNVSEAFAEPFILVQGTAGDDMQNRITTEITNRILADWTRTHFGRCRVTTDSALKPGTEQELNLILIGSPETNSVWRELSSTLALKVFQGHVEIDGHTVQAPEAGVIGVVPHPKVPNRKVVLVHAPGGHTQIGSLNLSVDGWYRAAVWATRANGCLEAVYAQ